ncbi:MAG TPA: NRDE family protein [Acidimicrobiales bacterium]
MCLLVVAWQVVPGTPVLIGANRDEFLERPTTLLTVLNEAEPRILGGRDEHSGGTWLAVNEHGVFGALTNQPLGDDKDLTKRTRGELPLALATARTAAAGAADLVASFRPADFNGCWLLTGDRDSLWYIDFTGLTEPRATPLAPGIHILENKPMGAESHKASRVTEILGGLPGDRAASVDRLRIALADHAVPDSGPADGERPAVPSCVHLEQYGTRSSCIITVDADPGARPTLQVADGAPCTAPFIDGSDWWSAPVLPSRS